MSKKNDQKKVSDNLDTYFKTLKLDYVPTKLATLYLSQMNSIKFDPKGHAKVITDKLLRGFYVKIPKKIKKKMYKKVLKHIMPIYEEIANMISKDSYHNCKPTYIPPKRIVDLSKNEGNLPTAIDTEKTVDNTKDNTECLNEYLHDVYVRFIKDTYNTIYEFISFETLMKQQWVQNILRDYNVYDPPINSNTIRGERFIACLILMMKKEFFKLICLMMEDKNEKAPSYILSYDLQNTRLLRLAVYSSYNKTIIIYNIATYCMFYSDEVNEYVLSPEVKRIIGSDMKSPYTRVVYNKYTFDLNTMNDIAFSNISKFFDHYYGKEFDIGELDAADKYYLFSTLMYKIRDKFINNQPIDDLLASCVYEVPEEISYFLDNKMKDIIGNIMKYPHTKDNIDYSLNGLPTLEFVANVVRDKYYMVCFEGVNKAYDLYRKLFPNTLLVKDGVLFNYFRNEVKRALQELVIQDPSLSTDKDLRVKDCDFIIISGDNLYVYVNKKTQVEVVE